MEKTIVATGKTIDLAIENALNQLGLDRDSVSVQVLAQAKAGFLGFGAAPAKVQVTYEAPDPIPAPEAAPKTALSSASRSAKPPKPPKKETPKEITPENKPEIRKVDRVSSPLKDRPERQDRPRRDKPQPKAPRQQPEEKKAPAAPKVYAPAEPGSTEERIEVFLKGLLEHMGSDAVPHAWKVEENSYRVDLVGEDLGYLIGRRGDTLDAIQHLCGNAMNRGQSGHIRVSVDAEAYREKREDSLRRYARKKAQQVLKLRRRTTLEPMNAYERHVIHATLQDMENISTYSTGTEPNRRVVIEYVK